MQNLIQKFVENCGRFAAKPCFRVKKGGKWQDLSWTEAEEEVARVALGLKKMGIQKGDRVAIFSTTRVEWTLSDLAIQSLGAVSVPIYHSNTAEQAAYIIQNSEAKLTFVENESVAKRVQQGEIVLFEGKSHLNFEQLKAKGAGGDRAAWRKGIDTILSSDPATFVYTSGTTGNPKGAILTHGNFVAEIEGLLAHLCDISENDVSITFLPLAHIVAREMQFYQLAKGFTQAYAESMDKLVDNLAEIRPHFFVSVPRIFEKIYEKILQQVEQGSAVKQAIFSWATGVGREISRKKQAGRMIGPLLMAQGAVANALVFDKLKKKLGGRLRYTVSGGAPLSKEIAEFFHAAGILILEGYGLTETTGATNCNKPTQLKFGTVGPTVLGVEEKIAADGEVLIRGPVVFKGYYKNPEATKEAFTSDGWFKTGDIGKIDADGFLKITDRKKDLIVTAGGKNIAPQNLENLLKTAPMISQAVVVGDRRKYLTALLTLNSEPVIEMAQKQGISSRDMKELSQHPAVYAWVKKAVDEKNKGLPPYETIKKFAILESDFTQESGELTPTLKVKRKFVNEKYQQVVDELYNS